MSRLLPFPVLSLFLFLMWLLLTGFSAGQLALGLGLALVVPRVMLTLQVEKPRVRSFPLLFRVFVRMISDVARSNLAVARILLLNPPERQRGFVRMPTDLRNPHALAILAIIITATPGTLWISHDPDHHVVLIHVLDLVDEAAWIAHMKDRYEKPLLEIFP